MFRMVVILPAIVGAVCVAGVGNVDAAPIFRGGVYEENVNITCAAAANCTATFTILPEPVLLKRASCSIVTGAPNVTRAALGEVVGSAVQRPQFLVPHFVVTAANKSQYIVSTSVNLQMDAGEKPVIRVSTGSITSQSLACQLIGERLIT